MRTLIVTELKLLSRSPDFLAISMAFPVVFFLVMSEVFGGGRIGPVDMITYMMISMAAFGVISGSLNIGARVALERRSGWNRQLRLTPLPGWSYVASKVAVSMVMVLPTALLILLAGFLVKGVTLEVVQWGQILAAIWLGSLPFAVLGVLIGMAVKPETVSAITVASFLLLAMFGGLWMPVEVLPGFMAGLARALPSFWLADQARELIGGGSVSLPGLLVAAAWFAGASVLVVASYRRDAAR